MLFGDNIKLERFKLSDITIEYVGWLNDLEVTKYSNQRFTKHTYEGCIKYFQSFTGTSNLFLTIKTIRDSLYIGTVSIFVEKNHGVADIGIMIGNKNYWGQGVAKEAYLMIINFLFNDVGLRKITSGAIESNKAMISVMKYSGMHLEAVKKSHEILNGDILDIHYYAIFK